MSKAKKADCPERTCVPLTAGMYWATHRKYEWRTIVKLGRNGYKQLRVWAAGYSSSFEPTAFTDYVGPLAEATTKPK